MKSAFRIPVLRWALGGLAGLVMGVGCASFTPYEESVLIEAGFQPVASTGIYAALTPYKVEPMSALGKTAYAYRNEAKGITYLGDEAQYQRYQELIQEKGAQRIDVVNREISQEGMHMR